MRHSSGVSQARSSARRFARIQIGFIAATVFVIMWGALVRATRSGDGCGDAWPLCQGRWIPVSEQIETLIEFFHRVTSGMLWPWALVMLIFARRTFPARHPVRRWSGVALLLMSLEALIGALLVRRGLVADNDSLHRAIVMSFHLCNTLALLMAMTLTLWFARGRKLGAHWLSQSHTKWLALNLLGMAVVAAAGALSALADTLFPPVSVAQSFYEDFLYTSHFLVRVRVLHPPLAIGFSIYAFVLLGWFSQRNAALQKLGTALSFLIATQLAIGLANIYFLAPLSLQLLHLVIAELIWIWLVWFSAEALRD